MESYGLDIIYTGVIELDVWVDELGSILVEPNNHEGVSMVTW